MPRMVDFRQALAAAAQVDNVLSGKTEEFITRPTAVRVSIVASGNLVKATILASGVSMLDDQEVSAANRFPLLPDDVTSTFGLTGPTDRLVIRIRNTSAAARDIYTVVDTEPVA